MTETLHQRAWDLLRQMRGELSREALIDHHEYAWLAMRGYEGGPGQPGQGSPAPRRLESYDEHAARLKAAEAELVALRAQLAQVTQERDDEQKARLSEVEHWVQRYREVDAWRADLSRQLLQAPARERAIFESAAVLVTFHAPSASWLYGGQSYASLADVWAAYRAQAAPSQETR